MVLSISNNDGVIDANTWLRCQDKLEKNVQIKNSGKGKHTFLTGLLKCGYCGYSMAIKTYKEKKYLNCTGRYVTNSCIDKIETHYLYEIENYVFEEIKEFVSNFENLKISHKKTENDNEINNLKIELYKIETEIENLINNLSSANEILLKYANKKIIELDNKKIEILNTINEKRIKPININIPNLNDWENLSSDIKKNFVNKIINRILIFNNSIEIEWKH